MLIRRVTTFSLFPKFMQKFINTCNEIENNPNFIPGITNEELLALVVDQKGRALHHPPKQAVAIQRSSFTSNLGYLYEYKKTQNFPNWQVDDSLIILVNYNGNVSFHSRDDVKQGKFTYGSFPFLLLRHILEQECVHQPEIAPHSKTL